MLPFITYWLIASIIATIIMARFCFVSAEQDHLDQPSDSDEIVSFHKRSNKL